MALANVDDNEYLIDDNVANSGLQVIFSNNFDRFSSILMDNSIELIFNHPQW